MNATTRVSGYWVAATLGAGGENAPRLVETWKQEAAALARTRIEFGLRIPFKGESRREKQIPEERPQVQSQVRGRARARVVGAGAVADSRGVGRDASAGGRADRASRAADPARHPGKRSNSPGGTSASAQSHRRLCALGKAVGLRGLCWTEDPAGTATGTNAGRPGRGTAELRSVAARRKTATSGAGTHGGRAVHAELSASGGECSGRLRDREEQREPAVRGGQ